MKDDRSWKFLIKFLGKKLETTNVSEDVRPVITVRHDTHLELDLFVIFSVHKEKTETPHRATMCMPMCHVAPYICRDSG